MRFARHAQLARTKMGDRDQLEEVPMRLSGVMLNSEDPARLADLYLRILGEPGWRDGDEWFGWEIGDGSLMIGPHSEVRGRNTSPGRIMIAFESDDVPADFERIRDLGAEVVAEPYHPEGAPDDMWLATLADADGNYLQLASPYPGEE